VVQEEQTIFDVSQQYGIQLNELFRRNGLKPGQEPAAGEQLRLRGRPLWSVTNIRLREAASGVNSSGVKQGKD
jgi:LysM repeat protein